MSTPTIIASSTPTTTYGLTCPYCEEQEPRMQVDMEGHRFTYCEACGEEIAHFTLPI